MFSVYDMEKIITLKIDAAISGHKIEYVLENHMNLSVKLIRRLKRIEGGITLNGRNATVIEKVFEGDTLTVTVTDREPSNIVPVNMPLSVLYEDEDIIVVNKMRSMPTHPTGNHQKDTLANAVMYHLGENSVFHAITRLDSDTSGVVLIAKHTMAAAFLAEEIKRKRIKKKYIAVVNGCSDPEEGIISAPIKRREEGCAIRCVASDGKEAISQYKTIQKANGLSLLELSPVTGRTHQLRVHMSYIGTPIYGDSMYGAPQKGEKIRLHCHLVEFTHPMSKDMLTITAPIPTDIEELF